MFTHMRQIAVIIFLVLTMLPLSALAQGSGTYQGAGGGAVQIPSFFIGRSTPAGSQTFGGLVLVVLNILLLVVGSLSVLFFIIGGFRYVTSSGNEENAAAAKKTMLHAIIGLVVVIMSFALIYIITNVLISGAV
jgi:hypothetical protein